MLRLKQLRENRNLSQQYLADVMFTSQTSIYNYENGVVEPTIDMLKRLASFFDVSVDYLIGQSDDPKRVEITTGYQLNAVEAKHIEMYKQLSPLLKEAFDRILKSLISER